MDIVNDYKSEVPQKLLESYKPRKTPRCFKTIKQKPLEYEHNGKA